MTDFLTAFTLIAVAELGDKTQMLALAFSSKYKIRSILAGVGLGIFLNHGLAILLASALAHILSASYIRLLSAGLFLLFGLLSLRLPQEEEELQQEKERFGPVLTVASAFFLGELGDKSQLTAMALGGQSTFPLLVLIGTTSAMLCVSSIGIIVGKLLGKKLPRITLQFLSAIIFLFFGLQGLYIHLPLIRRSAWVTAVFLLLLFGCIVLILRDNTRRKEKALSQRLAVLLRSCKECAVHTEQCSISVAIHQASQKYLGESVPYLGRIILFLESMEMVAPEKTKQLENRLKDSLS